MRNIKTNNFANRKISRILKPSTPMGLFSASRFILKLTFCTSLILMFFFEPKTASAVSSPHRNLSRAVSLYKKALMDYKKGNLNSAYSIVQFILNNYETKKELSSDVDFLCGKILYRQKDFFDAKPYFQRIIYKNPNYKKIYNVIFYMARADFNMKNYRRSIRDFDFLIKRTKKNSALYDKSLAYLTLSYVSCGKMKKADKVYKKDHVKRIFKKIIYLKKKNNYFKLVYLNYLINHKNDLSDALLILNNKGLFSPKKKELCYKAYYEGFIAYKGKKYALAQNYFTNSSKYCTNYYYKSGLVYYGMALLKQKEPNGVKYIKKGASETGYVKIKLRALNFLIYYYKNIDDKKNELKYLKRMLFDFASIMPESKKTKLEKMAAGLIYGLIKEDYKNKHFAGAFKALKRIEFLISKKYIKPKTYLYLAKIRLKENKYKGALFYAKKYNDLRKSIGTKYFLANVYFKTADYKKSLNLINGINLKSVKRLNLIDKIVELKLKLYKKLNLNKDYIDLLKSSVNLLPAKDKIKELYFLGRMEFGKKDLKAASFYFNEVIKNKYAQENNNKNILYETYYYLGLINYKFNNFKLSMSYFKKGYELNKTGKHFQYELSQIAYIYMKEFKNKTLALKYYEILEKNASSSVYKNLADSMISAINMQK